MKKVMILTAERTGTGHKSAANAIEKKLNSAEYNVTQVDSFTMMGKLGHLLENSYIPLTTRCPLFFYIPYLFAQKFPDAVHSLIYLFSKKGLKREIEELKPDLIITVHSMFTKSVSRYINKHKLNTPFYIDVIDLVKPPEVWFDKNADVIFVPTNEVENYYLKKGFNKDKLFLSGFPIRDDIKSRQTPKKIDGKVNILLVNPSVNLKKNVRYVQEVSRLENSSVTVVCGRDTRMYDTLIKKKEAGSIPENVEIYGFVNNMNELLDKAHIVLAKGGPNMILETIKSSTTIVVTGHIQGQENKNYEYVVNNNFGFKCEDPEEIYERLNNFINNGELDKCLKNVLESNITNGAEFIADYIESNIK